MVKKNASSVNFNKYLTTHTQICYILPKKRAEAFAQLGKTRTLQVEIFSPNLLILTACLKQAAFPCSSLLFF